MTHRASAPSLLDAARVCDHQARSPSGERCGRCGAHANGGAAKAVSHDTHQLAGTYRHGSRVQRSSAVNIPEQPRKASALYPSELRSSFGQRETTQAQWDKRITLAARGTSKSAVHKGSTQSHRTCSEGGPTPHQYEGHSTPRFPRSGSTVCARDAVTLNFM